MKDNVVYLGRQDEAEAKKAIRFALLDTMKSFRAGDIRAVVLITMENKSIGYRIAGECSDAELISALEFIKLKTLMEV